MHKKIGGYIMIEEKLGWRAKIGLICPGPSFNLIREWGSVLPEGVTCYQTVMGLIEGTSEHLLELREKAVVEAKKYAGAAPGLIDIILFACTSGSFIGGAGYDEKVIKDLEDATGIPSTTSTTCVLTAFADIGIKKIALVGPYIDEVLDVEVQFLKHNGIDTLYCKGMGYTRDMLRNIAEQPYIFYHWVREAYRAVPEADAIFVTCMAAPIRSVVEILEQETGKPVISSCSASLYGVLKQLGIKEPVEQYGQLLRLPR